jgi:serine O-acetyltransferase
MIETEEELLFYLDADKFALGRSGSPSLLGDEIWKFQILLRKCEYLKRKRGLSRLKYKYLSFVRKRLAFKLGFDIPEGVFGAGLRLNHFGGIVVNGASRVGRWCDLHQGVNIGAGNPRVRTGAHSPNIGDHVWIGPGAKIYGDITIGSRVQIGANAVVGRSFGDDITIAGVPARVIREEGTSEVDVVANPARAKQFFADHPQWRKYESG